MVAAIRTRTTIGDHAMKIISRIIASVACLVCAAGAANTAVGNDPNPYLTASWAWWLGAVLWLCWSIKFAVSG